MQARLRMEYRLSVMELEGAIGVENVSLAEDMPRANP